jgi:glycogen debranching enzyme
MALALKQAPAVAGQWNHRAEALRTAINRHLWMNDQGSYAYFLHGTGELRGTQAKYQEATGLSLAILFGIPDPARQRQIFSHVRLSRWGIPLVDPEFARYSADQPGRHSRIVWPMAQGYWASAAAKAGEMRLFQNEVEALAQLAQNSGWNFYEIYNAATGRPDGGWQCGRHWNSCQHQTWSATAFIRMIHYGLFGMSFEPTGVAFAPRLPAAWGAVTLRDLHYRNMTLAIRLSGAGTRITGVRLDGRASEKAFIPAGLTGPHEIDIQLGEAAP